MIVVHDGVTHALQYKTVLRYIMCCGFEVWYKARPILVDDADAHVEMIRGTAATGEVTAVTCLACLIATRSVEDLDG